MKHSAENKGEELLKLVRLHSASDEVHRIVPLGFTLREAKAWYVNHIILPRLRPASVCLATGFVILLLLVSPFGESFDGTLSTVILLNFLFVVVGFICGYAINRLLQVPSGIYNGISRIRFVVTKMNFVGKEFSLLIIAAAIAILTFWHMPVELDAAVLNAKMQIEMHLTLFLSGCLLFGSSQLFSRNMKTIASIVAGKAMGLFGLFLLLTSSRIYSIYPAYEQGNAGVLMLLVMCVLDFTVMPLWLYSYFGKSLAHRPYQ